MPISLYSIISPLWVGSVDLCDLLVHLFVALLLHSCLHPRPLLPYWHVQDGTLPDSESIRHNHRSGCVADPLLGRKLRCPATMSCNLEFCLERSLFFVSDTNYLFEVEVRTSSRHLVNTLPFSIVKHIGGEKRITFSSFPVRSTSTWKLLSMKRGCVLRLLYLFPFQPIHYFCC